MNRLLRTLCCAALAVTVSSPALAEYKMRLGMVTVNDILHDVAKKYKEELEARTDGEVVVEIFPAAQLGNIPVQIENIKIGAQAAFMSPSGFLAGLNRNFQVVDAPGIYNSSWHAQNALMDPEFHDKFVTLAEKQGIVGAMLYNYGPTSIAAVKTVNTLEDLKGLKIRTLATKMESDLASVLGMTGVPMSLPETLPAIQQGTIDGARTSIAVMTAGKYYATTKHIVEEESGMIIAGLWVSKAWLNRLPEELQKAVLETGRELEEEAMHISDRHNAEAAQVWKDNGAQVVRFSPEDHEELMKKLSPLGDKILGEDPETKDMYELLKSVLDRVSADPPQN